MHGSMGERGTEHLVRVAVGPVTIEGCLNLPEGAHGVVLFAHGSGSSRLSPRNRYVARTLNQAGLATLLGDFLTSDEEAIDLRSTHLRFDIGLLTERLTGATDWLTRDPRTRHLRIGHFGAAPAPPPPWSRRRNARTQWGPSCHGAGPDLAGPALARVQAPTLSSSRETTIPSSS
jgi:putative phosphoribosyl transferase